MPSNQSGTLQFSVDARHLRQLGRELVADRTTAVAELVKNAYDADATQVVVDFVDASSEPGGTLIVSDDGEGMTLADVQSRWMRISTPIKEENSRSSAYHRVRAGKKGIGRFAAESLGSQLMLSSTVSGSSEAVEVTFLWDTEFADGTELTSVENRYRIVAAPKEDHWTKLEIRGLRTAWDDEDIAGLQRIVVLLQPPFPLVKPSEVSAPLDPGFSVSIRKNEIAIENHPGFESFLDSATAVVSGGVDENGRGIWRVRSTRLDINESRASDKLVLTTGRFTFDAYYFVHERNAIGSIGVAISRAMGSEYGGIRLYRDGLRVPPFGGRGDDWLTLNLESRRRAILPPVATNNWFGAVAISRDENILLVDTASREGVIENDAFEELRRFVRDGLFWGAQQVAVARNRKLSSSERRRTTESPASRVRILDEAFERAENAVQLARAGKTGAAKRELAEIERTVRKEAKREDSRQQRETKRLLRELQVLRLLASLGTSIIVFSHEVRGVLNGLRSQISDIEEVVDGKASAATLKEIHGLAQLAGQSVDTLGELTAYIEGFASGTTRRTLEAQPLFDVIEGFVAGIRPLTEHRGVEMSWAVIPPHLRTCPMHRAELEAVLFNLLTNAIKAMDTEGQTARRISISASATGAMVQMRFEDNGHGVDEKLRPKLFEAFVTSSAPGESVLGAGTGLGLKVVSDIVQEANGTIVLAEPSQGFSTCFEIRLPAAKE